VFKKLSGSKVLVIGCITAVVMLSSFILPHVTGCSDDLATLIAFLGFAGGLFLFMFMDTAWQD